MRQREVQLSVRQAVWVALSMAFLASALAQAVIYVTMTTNWVLWLASLFALVAIGSCCAA